MNISGTSCFFKKKQNHGFFVEPICPPKKSTFVQTSQLMGWISEDHVLSYLEEEGLRIEPQWSHGLFFFLSVSGVWVETAKGERGQWPCWHGTSFWTVFSIHVLLVSISPERMLVTRIITIFTRGFLISRPSCCSTGIQNPGWLFDIGDYTSQLYGDYNNLIYGSLQTNHYNEMSSSFFTALDEDTCSTSLCVLTWPKGVAKVKGGPNFSDTGYSQLVSRWYPPFTSHLGHWETYQPWLSTTY